MDPTYPLVPIANLLSAFLVLLALLSNGVRQSWNTGVTMFGFWIFVVAVCIGVNTIVWSDNTNNSAPVWCDISSHLEVASNVGIPASSLVITHRLYKIIQRQAVEPRTKHMKYIELLFDLFLGLGLPILVTGFYYVVQGARFLILEEFGCSDAYDVSGLEVLIIDGWGIVLPIISIACPLARILWRFYRHSRQTNAFLRTNASVNRAKYIRVFAIGCIDILLTLPIGFIRETLTCSMDGRASARPLAQTSRGDIGLAPSEGEPWALLEHELRTGSSLELPRGAVAVGARIDFALNAIVPVPAHLTSYHFDLPVLPSLTAYSQPSTALDHARPVVRSTPATSHVVLLPMSVVAHGLLWMV